MKTRISLALLTGIGLMAFAPTSWAADTDPGNGAPGGYQNHHANPDDPNWFRNTEQWSKSPVPQQVQNQRGVVPPEGEKRADPPGPRPPGPLTPADVEGLVRQFQQDREAFMAKRKALEQQMKGLAEQDRQRLREQLKDQMDQWKQQQSRLREQLREQCERMQEQLRDHSRLVERAGNRGGSPGQGGGGGGPRGR